MVAGRLGRLAERRRSCGHRLRVDRHARERHRPLRVRHLDRRWDQLVGRVGRRRRLDRSRPRARRWCTSAASTAWASPPPGCSPTVRLDRTAPTAPSLPAPPPPGRPSPRSPSPGAARPTPADPAWTPTSTALPGRRHHLGDGVNGAPTDVTDEGQTPSASAPIRRGQRPRRDRGQHRPARPHRAHRTDRHRRVTAAGTASRRSPSASRRDGRRLRPRRLQLPHLHQRRRDLVGAAPPAPRPTISAEGETLVQFRAIDAAGNASAAAALTAAGVRIDRTTPTGTPVVAAALRLAQHRLVTSPAAARPTPAAPALATSRTGRPRTAARPGRPAPRRLAARHPRGDTLVQFQAADQAGNLRPGSAARRTARIDRSSPSDPTVSGGSLSWQSAPRHPGGGRLGRRRRGPGRLPARTPRPTAAPTGSARRSGARSRSPPKASPLVRFRALDGVGLGAGGGRRPRGIDRTGPTRPPSPAARRAGSPSRRCASRRSGSSDPAAPASATSTAVHGRRHLLVGAQAGAPTRSRRRARRSCSSAA